jgi:hypothetical protein
MIAPRLLLSGATVVAALAAVTGCRDVLGFQESTAIQTVCASSNDCLPSESCAGQTCHARCRSTGDCSGNESCVTVADVSSTLCMAPDAGSAEDAGPMASVDGAEASIELPDVGVAPSGDGAADAALDGPACDADLTSDPQNCGTCGSACAAPNVCVASGCHQVAYAGQQAAGNHYVGVAPDAFTSIQVHVGEDSWATAIGLIASQASPPAIAYPDAYLGIYADTGGGSPGTLVAALAGGGIVAVMPGRNEFAFSAPVRLETGYYWLAGVFDNSMPFDAQDGISSTWNFENLASFQPLPPTAPPQNELSSVGTLAPNFYLVLAQ